MRLSRLARYSVGARVYDVISGERPVYRPGRVLGVARCELQAGDRVLDLACGTGLNEPLLIERVGPSGEVLGVDASEQMLTVARAKADRDRWTGVEFRQGGAGRLVEHIGDDAAFDAVIVTYALSIIGDWQTSFNQALAALRPGGRFVVVDMSYPTGRWRVFAPLAWLAFVVGGIDPRRAPWRLVEQQCDSVRHEVLRGGHIHVVSGTKHSGAPS